MKREHVVEGQEWVLDKYLAQNHIITKVVGKDLKDDIVQLFCFYFINSSLFPEKKSPISSSVSNYKKSFLFILAHLHNLRMFTVERETKGDLNWLRPIYSTAVR